MLKRPVVSPGHSRKPIRKAGKDKRVFSKTADRSHYVNAQSPSGIMRGGYRL